MMRLALAVVLAALLAGCAEHVRQPVPAVPRAPEAEPEAQPPVAPPRPSARARPQARTLSMRADCSGRDPGGYVERIALTVSDGHVAQLEASVDIPRKGSCHFRLEQFRQTKRTPFVELLALRDGSRCAVRIWTQGDRVTVAATDCHEMCASRRTFESVWPFQLSASTGRCQ